MASFPNIALGEGFTRTHELFEHLLDDVLESYRTLESDKDSQYLRRVSVRSVFSFLEAIVHIIKHEIKSDLKLNRYSYSLTTKDSEVLYEKKIRNEEEISFFIPIDENIKKTFALASRVWELAVYNLDTNNAKYSAFLLAIETRNKLTHPRTYYDIQITSDDMSNITGAYFWAKSEFIRLIRMKVESISAELPPDVYAQLMGSENS